MFIHPAAGDFRLIEGSPAIDAANTSADIAWPGTDILAHTPVDDPLVDNRGR